MVLDDCCSPAATLKGKAFHRYRHFTTSRLPFELDITVALPFPSDCFFGQTATKPSTSSASFIDEQALPRLRRQPLEEARK
jgi:hypothetical protein